MPAVKARIAPHAAAPRPPPHQVAAAGACPQWQSTSDHPSQTGEIGGDAEQALRPTVGDPEPGDQLVEDEQRPVLAGDPPQALQIPGSRRDAPCGRCHGLDGHGGDLPAAPREDLSRRLHRVVRNAQVQFRSDPPKVVGTGDTHDQRPPGHSPRDARGSLQGAGLAVEELHNVGAGECPADAPAEPVAQPGGVLGRHTPFRQRVKSGGHLGGVVPEDGGTAAQDEVEMACAVGVDEVGSPAGRRRAGPLRFRRLAHRQRPGRPGVTSARRR